MPNYQKDRFTLVLSIQHLRILAKEDPAYGDLALHAAIREGADGVDATTADEAIGFLHRLSRKIEAEFQVAGEAEVVRRVNAVRTRVPVGGGKS